MGTYLNSVSYSSTSKSQGCNFFQSEQQTDRVVDIADQIVQMEDGKLTGREAIHRLSTS
jgi:hypothetical protein